MYQSITLVGNLGKDPETRNLASGSSVTSFNMAVSKKWTGQDGTQQERTIWFRISAWNKLGITAQTYLHKGSKVLVIGELEEPHTYETNGEHRASLEVTAQTVRFLDSRGDKEESAPVKESAPNPVIQQDIPF